MSKKITRRDFLNGVSISLAGAALIDPKTALSEAITSSPASAKDYYPPTLTGMRGSHKGSFETAHKLAWRGIKPSTYTDLDEHYDLIVVGAGISGLAAASLYQQKAGKQARILILDNHDDFGGHAKRNEFHSQGRMLLGAGGSGNFQDRHLYSPESLELITSLGFNLDELSKNLDPQWPLADFNQPVGLYTDRKHFGKDAIINGHWFAAWHGYGNYQELVATLSLPKAEQEKLIQLIEGKLPLLKPLPTEDMKGFLKHTPYQTFMTEYLGFSSATGKLFNPIVNITYGVGIDSLSIDEGVKTGLPALSVLGEAAMAVFAESGMSEETNFVWLPDGNASLTRQMVRRLIPNVAAGTSVEDLMDARFDYSQLDRPDRAVRLRLNSSVVNALNNTDGSVSVAYETQDKAYRLKAKHCIMACYNGLIPHLCPELPQAQKDSLKYGVKVPLLVANVLLRNGRAFHSSGSQMQICPTSDFKMVTTAPQVTIGNYKHSNKPEDPIVLNMMTSPTSENNGQQTARDLYRMARHKLYVTSFEEYEKSIREQLTGMFGAKGFDADKDIEAITLNRWSHGYAYEYLDLFDPEWPEGKAPHELGRKQFGKISIANSDSEASAYVNTAIDAAVRAVNEQLSSV